MPSMKTGAKWLTRDRRLAIYLRDGLACCYCGTGVEDGAQLQLDHIIPRSQGGSNGNGNLITACRKCNSSRGDRNVMEFIHAVAGYLNIDHQQISEHIIECVGREVDTKAARAMIKRRGSYAACLKQS